MSDSRVEIKSIKEDKKLRLVFYELVVKDVENGVNYNLALVSTRRGLSVKVVKKQRSD